MYQQCCKKCGSIALHIETKGNNTGLYCDDCGSWIKWLGKDELRAFNHAQHSKLPQTECDIPMPEVAKPKENNLRKCTGSINRYIDGNWQPCNFEVGCFHCWGMNYTEFESGAGNYSVAIVELPNGEVVMPQADSIRFIDK